MEIEVKESVSLEDGKHAGLVERIEYRTDPYEYTDIYIKELDTGFALKYGCPTAVSEKSKLGKLLSRFIELKKGTMVDPAKILVGREVTFMTITKQGKNNKEYTEIVDDSVKPVIAQKQEQVKD